MLPPMLAADTYGLCDVACSGLMTCFSSVTAIGCVFLRHLLFADMSTNTA